MPITKGFRILADEGEERILFCDAGWRSALATKTLQDLVTLEPYQAESA